MNCGAILEGNGSLRQRITDYFREEILAGRIAPGTQLPSTQQLASELETGVATVQRALTILTREGLITRLPRLGSVVTEQKKELRTVAVYSFFNPQFPPGPFLRLLTGYLELELKARGMNCRIYYDNQRPYSLKPFLRLYARREFDAAIFLDLKSELYPALESLTVPHASFGTIDAEVSRSCYPLSDLAELAVAEIARTGRRRVGVISSVIPGGGEPGPRRIRRGFYRILEEGLRQRGLELHPGHYVCGNEQEPGADVEEFARFAYRAFKRMWAQPNRPEVLFLYSDDCFSGLLAALYELGVRVPEELELVVHHNREHRMICPVACTYLENSIRDYAGGIIDVLIGRYRGVPPGGVLRYRAVQHRPGAEEQEHQTAEAEKGRS